MDAVINQQLLCKRGIFSSFPHPVGDSVGRHVSGRDRGETQLRCDHEVGFVSMCDKTCVAEAP